MSIDTDFVKRTATELGFNSCGVTDAGFLEDEAPRLSKWLRQGYHGKMEWMENHYDKRLNPSLLVEGAKSVISLTFNYFPNKTQESNTPKISKYAFGTDYHFVVKERMRQMVSALKVKYGEFNARVFVDSAPVLERALAAKAGLGWVGKHSLLLSKNVGSFFFIGQIITDLELIYDGPTTDHCGTCTACIDACPTEAIVENKVVDSNKCISYLTIELKEEIPTSYKNQMEDWVMGCDICQDVCPWNRFSKPHNEPAFEPQNDILSFNWREWEEITSSAFKRRFANSPLRRTSYKSFMRNLNFTNPTYNNGSE
jgi:epoxyqueuosine reductase